MSLGNLPPRAHIGSLWDISDAGRRQGITGVHSGLWNAVADAVPTLQPACVYVENVAALRRRGFDVVHADLATLGYDTRWICLRAADIRAAHRRDRLLLLALRRHHSGAADDVANAVRP